ncbi:copper resistance CopC family protein [Cellulomonas sp. Y8]|uniref:copper resistance CopC family protein n=1 Tax=Cellulomonas sp. Y8 TaxID=2591145 RepID=UPI003D760AC9
MSFAHRRATARLAAGSALAGLLLLAAAGTASAHDELAGSEPASGAALDAAPAAVRLDFSGDVLTFGAAVVVADDADETWQVGDPVLDGASVSVPLDPALPDGAYEIRWRVVSSDGHPITGLVPFTVGDVDADGADDASAAPAPTSDDADPAGGTGEQTAAADAASNTQPGSAPPWRTPAIAGGGAALALGAYTVVVVLRGRRSARTPR